MYQRGFCYHGVDFEIIIWYNVSDEVIGFELHYGKGEYQRALRWDSPSRYSHYGVDDGDDFQGGGKKSPILVSDGIFDFRMVAEQFREHSQEMNPDLAGFVYDKILAYQ